MTHQAHHHLVLHSGKQPGVNKDDWQGPLAGVHRIFLQSNWNVAGPVVGQEGKQGEQHKQQAKPISVMVELVTHVRQNAPPFSMTSSKSASSERVASHGRKRMVPQSASAKSVAIDLRIGCVSLALGLAIAMRF